MHTKTSMQQTGWQTSGLWRDRRQSAISVHQLFIVYTCWVCSMCTIKAQAHTQNYHLHCSPLNYMVSLIYVAPVELTASTVKNLGPGVTVHVTQTALTL